MGVAVIVSVIHLLFHEGAYVLLSMLDFGSSSPLTFYGLWNVSKDEPLTTKDHVAAGLCVLAGVLQHGSELQRYLFKKSPKNAGKIHTEGLFSLARGINHTGHVLRDFASCLFAPTPFVLLYLGADYDLLCRVFPETVEHMRSKYGKVYINYEKKVPWKFIPGVW